MSQGRNPEAQGGREQSDGSVQSVRSPTTPALPVVRRRDGPAHRQARPSRWVAVLGLHQIPGLQWHKAALKALRLYEPLPTPNPL